MSEFIEGEAELSEDELPVSEDESNVDNEEDQDDSIIDEASEDQESDSEMDAEEIDEEVAASDEESDADSDAGSEIAAPNDIEVVGGEDADGESNHGQYEIFNTKKMKLAPLKKKKKKVKKSRNQFIEYEAELSEGEIVSEDEIESSGDEEDDKELLAADDEECASDDEERIRSLYHKQLDNDDRRQVLILKEQLEEKEIAMDARRHKRFRWQMVDEMDRLGKHDDMDDFEDGSDDGLEGSDNEDNKVFAPRLRQPTSDFIFLDRETGDSQNSLNFPSNGQPTTSTTHPKLNSMPNQGSSDINKFLFRDKDTVTALSATNNDHRLIMAKATREDKDRIVEREIKRVLQSKSIFDKLFD